MNLKAKCVNPQCPAFDQVKSVMVGQMSGFGAPNDRVKCPHCLMLMRTTQSIDVSSGKGTAKRSVGRKVISRSPLSSSRPRLGSKKRTKKTITKRGPSKRA
jgi:hypothetical protein